MPKFALSKVKTINAKQAVHELEIDGVKVLNAFENQLTGTSFQSEYKTLLTYIEYAANNGSLPATKFKDITPKGEVVKEYEFKSKHLRIYAIKASNGKIIVLCGLKKNQKSDITSFRSIKKQFCNAINVGKRK